MPTSSTLATARLALKTAFDTGELAGKSHYAWPGTIVEKGQFEGVWISDVTAWSSVLPNIKAGRMQRQEDYTFRVSLWVARPDLGADGAQTVFERALTLFDVIDSALADDVQLDKTDIQWMNLADREVFLIPHERGWACLIETQIEGRARLT